MAPREPQGPPSCTRPSETGRPSVAQTRARASLLPRAVTVPCTTPPTPSPFPAAARAPGIPPAHAEHAAQKDLYFHGSSLHSTLIRVFTFSRGGGEDNELESRTLSKDSISDTRKPCAPGPQSQPGNARHRAAGDQPEGGSPPPGSSDALTHLKTSVLVVTACVYFHKMQISPGRFGIERWPAG